jgi:large subunit ribosomal protein L11
MSEVVINGLIEGGKATGGAPFGPALGPLGVNITAIVNEINDSTKAYEGIKVPVKVIVDSSTKKYTIEIGAPPTSALILKEIGIAKGSKIKAEIAGNITLEQVKKIAEAKSNKLYGDMRSKVLQVLGTCKSMNITCEGMDAKEYTKEIINGKQKI